MAGQELAMVSSRVRMGLGVATPFTSGVSSAKALMVSVLCGGAVLLAATPASAQWPNPGWRRPAYQAGALERCAVVSRRVVGRNGRLRTGPVVTCRPGALASDGAPPRISTFR
jgi:hypothetical protein